MHGADDDDRAGTSTRWTKDSRPLRRAPVLEDPGHSAITALFLCSSQHVTQIKYLLQFQLCQSSRVCPGKTVTTSQHEYDYTDRQLVDVSPDRPPQNRRPGPVTVIAAGCSLGAHFGQVYVDGADRPFRDCLSRTRPAQANARSNITYSSPTRMAHRLLPQRDSNVCHPPYDVPIDKCPGLTCTTPATGAAGTISCTIGTLSANAGGRLFPSL